MQVQVDAEQQIAVSFILSCDFGSLESCGCIEGGFGAFMVLLVHACDGRCVVRDSLLRFATSVL
jgi:hypothetical protein